MTMLLLYIMPLILSLNATLAACDQTAETFDLERFKRDTAGLIPSNREIPGFTVVRGPSYYGPHNLWDYINGGALPYLDYGVRGTAAFTGMFASDSMRVTIDLYHMPDDLKAFGIYSSERDREARFLPIGAEGYATGTALFFWKGEWYVKVAAAKETSLSGTAMEDIARWIEKRIPGASGPPSFLALFPAEGKIPKSEQYIAKDVLGLDFLKRAVAAEYTLGDSSYRLFLIDSLNREQAVKDFQGCMEYIKESGGVSDAAISIGDETFAGNESFYGTVLFARKGRWILASAGLPDLKLAERIIGGIILKLPMGK